MAAWYSKSRKCYISRIKITGNGKEFRKEFHSKTAEDAEIRKNKFMLSPEYEKIRSEIKGFTPLRQYSPVKSRDYRVDILKEICKRKHWDFDNIVEMYVNKKDDEND